MACPNGVWSRSCCCAAACLIFDEAAEYGASLLSEVFQFALNAPAAALMSRSSRFLGHLACLPISADYEAADCCVCVAPSHDRGLRRSLYSVGAEP